MTMGWHLSDQEFINKFDVVPTIINDWARDVGGLEGKTVLDFGCGEGIQAAAIADKYSPAVVYGVDTLSEHEQLPDILIQYGRQISCRLPTMSTIRPGAPAPFRSVDFIYSWSVFEHVDLNIFDQVVTDLHDVLNDGGHMFIQVAPLYFSAEGAHLWAAGYKNWEHLTEQHSFMLRHLQSQPLSPEAVKQIWGMFLALNRITAPELVSRIEAGGFKLIRKFETCNESDPPRRLLNAYSEAALRTEQIVALFEKA